MRLASWQSNGEAFLDRWTLVHLAFWFVVGANLQTLGVAWGTRWVLIIVGAFIWEIIETGLERHTTLVSAPESLLNRWVSDPIMGVVGGALGMVLFV